mmetsp:Transcript_37626/g.52260  ORF Transcript_37626/g.52260 Transcript_37626/m.52260 type:complete len:306 (+) Transcript_37626:62-979(+)|eukprot:CAMPEP_0196577200 /NCGR_PEP_ID=MMETSP1081-20130531/6305_1 /TAXON_ID=36882 /ORGANISM="Pyramimonas amylifera, Strain CCMP720" /LENGTH=305 /DNA_ID=CAMNT_0041896055 /DNA_START=51 /DNA_END=968 /DNA_ORIENTATION=-
MSNFSKSPSQVPITQQVRIKNYEAVAEWVLRTLGNNKEDALDFLKAVAEKVAISEVELSAPTDEGQHEAHDGNRPNKRPRVENPELHFLETDMANKEGSVFLLFPNNSVGAIIGKAACNMKEITRRSGCRVQVERDSWGESRLVSLTGTLRQVTVGAHFVADFAGTDDMYMLVPNKVCGLIIGAKGANIKKLENETGAKLRMELENEDVRKLFIGGDLGNRCHVVFSVASLICSNIERNGPFDPRVKLHADHTLLNLRQMPQEVQFDANQAQQAGFQQQAALQQLQLQQLRQLQAQSQFGGPSGF